MLGQMKVQSQTLGHHTYSPNKSYQQWLPELTYTLVVFVFSHLPAQYS